MTSVSIQQIIVTEKNHFLCLTWALNSQRAQWINLPRFPTDPPLLFALYKLQL